MNNLVYANFSINICILCCFTIIATSAIPPDYEYRKRLEEYYKSIGESFPQQTSNEIVATTEHPLQSSTPSQYHNYYYHENAKSREHNSEHNNKNEYDRYNNQKEYESSQSDSNQPDDISVDDLYQQRLKEHYQNIKKLQHLNQQNEVNEVDNNQGPEVKAPVIIENDMTAEEEYQQRLKKYYESIDSQQTTTKLADKHIEAENDENQQSYQDKLNVFYKQTKVNQHKPDDVQTHYSQTEKNYGEDFNYQQRLNEYYKQIGANHEKPNVQPHYPTESETHKEDNEDQSYQQRLDEYYKQIKLSQDRSGDQDRLGDHDRSGDQDRPGDQDMADDQDMSDDQYKTGNQDKAGDQVSQVIEKSDVNGDKEYQQRVNEYYKQIEANNDRHDKHKISPEVHSSVVSVAGADKSSDLQKPDNGLVEEELNLKIDNYGGYIKSPYAHGGLGSDYINCIPGNYQLQCNREFKAVSNINFQLACQHSQFAQMPECSKSDVCRGLPEVKHAQINVFESDIRHSGDMLNTYPIGTSVKFVCNYYAFPEDTSLSMKSECLPGGTWSSYPKCVAMPTCNLYTYLNHIQNHDHHLITAYKNVTILHSPLHQGNRHVIPGSIVQHKCHPNYIPDTSYGHMQVQCLPNGQWSKFPQCTITEEYKRGCVNTPDTNLISRNHLITKSYHITQFGGQVFGNITYTCEDNYEPLSPNEQFTVSCLNSVWTKLPVCKPQPMCSVNVDLPQCARIVNRQSYYLPGKRNQGYLPGSYIEFVCAPHAANMRQQFSHTHTSKLLCESRGTWRHIMNSK